MKALIKFVIITLIAIEPVAFVMFFTLEGDLFKIVLAAVIVGSYLLGRKLYNSYLAESGR